MMIDEKILLNFIQEDADFDQAYVDRLFQIFKRYNQEFQSTTYSDDDIVIKEIVDLSHKLRSGCHTFGAMLLEKDFRQLEHAGKTSDKLNIKMLFEKTKKSSEDSISQLESILTKTFEKKA